MSTTVCSSPIPVSACCTLLGTATPCGPSAKDKTEYGIRAESACAEATFGRVDAGLKGDGLGAENYKDYAARRDSKRNQGLGPSFLAGRGGKGEGWGWGGEPGEVKGHDCHGPLKRQGAAARGKRIGGKVGGGVGGILQLGREGGAGLYMLVQDWHHTTPKLKGLNPQP